LISFDPLDPRSIPVPVREASMHDSGGPRRAASVAFVRDTDSGIQIYFSRRPAHFRYFPGAFVFPGGRAEDFDLDLKETACREVLEEIAVEIGPSTLRLLRETYTARHAGPVYHLFIYACEFQSVMSTSPNPDEVEAEVWLTAREALGQLDLPYQIMAAVQSISQFETVEDLMRALEHGSFDGDEMG
jgi:8-oxo-dGTP pyrophosphatase MutT (NUDIX family)